MSLDVALKKKFFKTTDKVNFEECYDIVFDYNITHNLGGMADKANLYEALWRPHRLKENYNIPEDDYDAEYEFESSNTVYASEIIPILQSGLSRLKSGRKYYEQFNPENGWGNYDGLVKFVEEYLKACLEFPDAIIITNR